MDVYYRMRRRRLELGLSQGELATILGYQSRSAIAKIEAGRNDIPLSRLYDFAHALDTTPAALLSDATPDEGFAGEPGGSKVGPSGSNRVAIILAGGKSARNRHNIPNQYINVQGKPVISYCMEAYQNHPLIGSIYVVCQRDWARLVEAYADGSGISKMQGVINAGPTGIESAFNAVKTLRREGYSGRDIIVFQESTRPFVAEEMISKLLSVASKKGSAITCEAKEDEVQFLREGEKTAYLDRRRVINLQSPDAHEMDFLVDLFDKAERSGHKLRESCIGMLMANLGMNLNFCEGGHSNLKIIRQEDIAVFNALLTQ